VLCRSGSCSRSEWIRRACSISIHAGGPPVEGRASTWRRAACVEREELANARDPRAASG
jgi:hypothetical protein